MSIAPDNRPNRSATGGPRRPVWGPLILVSLLAGILGVGGWLFFRDETTGALPGFSRLPESQPVTELADTSGRLKSIRIDTQERTLSLKNDGEKWRLANRHGYPAAERQVEELIDRLKNMKATYVSDGPEPVSTNMGLGRPEDSAGPAAKLSLMSEKGESLGTLTLGTTISMPGSELKEMTAVIPADSREVMLVEGRIEISALPGDWIDTTITDLSPERIAAITVKAPDRTQLTLRRGEEGDFSVEEGLPPGEEVKAKWILRDAASSLTDLRFIDVQPAEEFQKNAEQGELWETRITTRNEIVYEIRLKQDENETWGRFEAVSKNPESTEEIRRFNERHSNWAYLLNQYAANQFTLRPSDLLSTE